MVMWFAWVIWGEFFSQKNTPEGRTETHKSSFFLYKHVSGRNGDHEWLRMTNTFILCDSVWKVQKRHAANREDSFNYNTCKFNHLYIHPCIYPFIHSFIHPCIYPFIHSFIHASIHSFIHPYIYPFIHSFMHISIHSFIYASINSFIHTSMHLSIHSSIHSFIHPCIYPSIYSFIQSCQIVLQ